MRRDDLCWEVYHDFSVLYDVVMHDLKQLAGTGEFPLALRVKPDLRVSAVTRKMLRALQQAADAYERGGLPAAKARLEQAYKELPAAPTSTKAVLTGHAHIDLVWLWPERMGEFKTVHSFATADRMLERYPEFRFGYSQSASYRAVAERSPEIFSRVQKRIAEKRWDATGAMEVESETQLPCGEALARSFTLGQSYFAELRGDDGAKVVWLPDAFGYSACLPQIMQQTGVPYFFTSKLGWNAINAFPYSSFVWRGHDGSEVVSHIMREHGYNSSMRVDELRDLELAHRQSDVHPEYLCPTGYGDGGGGTTEEMCERARRFANLASVPPAEWGNIEAFFDRLDGVRQQLPVYQGELYFEYHRGTYTTHGDMKQAFRALERALQVYEAVRCGTHGWPIDEAFWRRIVFAQFHDYIPGSSIHEVYAEGIAEHEALAGQAYEEALEELWEAGNTEQLGDLIPSLYNPLPRPRLHVLGVDAKGNPEVVKLPPLAGVTVASLERVSGVAPVQASTTALSNGRVSAKFDSQGRVESLVIDGETIALESPIGELVICRDIPHLFEAWDIDRNVLSSGQPVRGDAEASVEHANASRATVTFKRSLGDAGEAVLRYSLTAGDLTLQLQLEIDWKQPEALLKLMFPTSYTGRHARYGAPFGSVLRGQQPGELKDEAQWEVPASRWAAVCDDAERAGLFVVTEAKYGFSCRDGLLGLTLLKSAAITDEGTPEHSTPSHPWALRRTHAKSQFSDIGKHEIALAFGRYDIGAPRDEQPAALADLLFGTPLTYAHVTSPKAGFNAQDESAGLTAGFLGLSGGETLQPTWAKPLAASKWVLRLNETLGQRGTAKLHLAPGWTAHRVTLLDAPVDDQRGITEVAFKPYELISVLIEKQ